MQAKQILGVFIILVSLIWPTYKIEKSAEKIIISYHDMKIKTEEKNRIKRAGQYMQNDIVNIRQKMSVSKNQINELVQQSFELNDEINKAFRDTLMNIETADSINRHYTKLLADNEHNIDSVNSSFVQQSDSLIIKINAFADNTYQIKVTTFQVHEKQQFIFLQLGLIMLYLILLIIGLSKGIKLVK